MISVEVCLSPELIGKYQLQKKIVVVVDVLRATSCMTAGLASGVDHIVPFESVEECEKMRSSGYLIAGERGGQKIEGFDLGNSPFEYIQAGKNQSKIAVTTTNGTKAIKISSEADQILIGSFLNLSSIVNFILSKDQNVVVICAGWRGKVNLEDSLFAGALIADLAWRAVPADDSALLCKSSYLMIKNQQNEIVEKSEHAKRLKEFGITDDIRFCVQIDKYDLVPIYKDGKISAAKT